MLIKVWIEQGAKNIIDTTTNHTSGCDTNNVTLSGKINTILTNYCLSCHGNANAQSLGANIKLQDSIDIVVRRNRLLGSLEHLPGFFAMPLSQPKLDTCKIKQFSIWLRKLKIDTSTKCDTNNVTFTGTLTNILNYNCLTCHSNANAQSLGAGIKLQDSVDVVARPRLIGSIEHIAGYYAMPLGQSKLDTCKITQFAIWFRKLHVVDTTKPRPPIVAGYACFSRDILPIIQSSCSMSGTNCHNGSGEESFLLTNYNEVRQILIPGHPNSSSLYVVITNTSENFMPPPPYNPLPQSNIDSIYSWILHGATNGICTVICDTNKFTFTNYVFPIIQTNCKGCHSGSSAMKGVKLEDYATISPVATSGQLVKSITGNGSPVMPPGNPLSSCNVRIIEKWAGAGAPNNK
jgi:hypothetical protein